MSLFRNTNALESLELRLAELEAKHVKLGSTIRNLELEYIELYDKVRHQMSRMAKRYAPEPPVLNDSTVDTGPDDGVDPISRDILALRNAPRPGT